MSNALRETVLPNGMRVFCLRKREVRIIYRQVQEYFKHGIELREGDVVFDVGANIGLFTLSAYEHGKHNVAVYAFEPIPIIFEALKLNAQRYNAAKLKVFPYALSRECGTITFAYYPNATPVSTAYPYDVQAEFVQPLLDHLQHVRGLRWLVPPRVRSLIVGRIVKRLLRMQPVVCTALTLSVIVREHDVPRIDLLKVDVEKSELDVLLGIEDQDWPKIKQVIVEVHDIDHRVEKVTALLRQHNFSEIVVDPSVAIFGVFNLYAMRRES